MLRRKGYIGRQLRPSQLAKELLDPTDQLWCTTCHMAVQKKIWQEHKQSRNHTLAAVKLKKMKRLSLDMWERHRGAPLHEESGREVDIEKEFQRFRAEQREREGYDRYSSPH
ncbi:uncharacterized protein TEOVI_000676600 [Trypanosoma equiperdum]|uniref:Uncharacterized protein n=4 Tax=Trypanozoon TaxID=39700 RepID=Q584W3_TRYB2|nr:hypothetical protein, conserved [Trypanosoma brucei brucei TREU927]AAX79959.1 hypothetical protein, conserved [Trypanosoma brucei]AAZ11882.1 hypothetical protein, conserved [Trypanosoma brucei brucei TREU927]RHW71945.1 hypothetical protein DPX39_060035200 [Trypanosoma brucei equiperdum]SCU67645.1 hypothetical protein, conserved [Trypanosoma equiperdum]